MGEIIFDIRAGNIAASKWNDPITGHGDRLDIIPDRCGAQVRRSALSAGIKFGREKRTCFQRRVHAHVNFFRKCTRAKR